MKPLIKWEILEDIEALLSTVLNSSPVVYMFQRQREERQGGKEKGIFLV